MTEADWLASEDPMAMLRAVGETGGNHPDRTFYGQAPCRASARKLRLFACACLGCDEGHVEEFISLVRGFSGSEERVSISVKPRDSDADSVSRIADKTPAQAAALLREVVGNPFRPVTLDRRCVGPAALSIAQAAYDCRIDGGALDPVRLAVLADCLEDEGCGEEDCPSCVAILAPTTGGLWPCRLCGARDWARRGKVPHPILAHLRIAPTDRHSPLCGTAFRGCAPSCPKDQWERNGPHVRGCWALDLVLGLS